MVACMQMAISAAFHCAAAFTAQIKFMNASELPRSIDLCAPVMMTGLQRSLSRNESAALV